MIMENVGNYAKAGLACVYVAWVCDDENNDAGARKCRVKAVALLRKARQTGQRFAERMGEELIREGDTACHRIEEAVKEDYEY